MQQEPCLCKVYSPILKYPPLCHSCWKVTMDECWKCLQQHDSISHRTSISRGQIFHQGRMFVNPDIMLPLDQPSSSLIHPFAVRKASLSSLSLSSPSPPATLSSRCHIYTGWAARYPFPFLIYRCSASPSRHLHPPATKRLSCAAYVSLWVPGRGF